jgi:hypothetical protein
MIKVLGDVSSGRHVDDRRTKFGEHLDRRLRCWESEGEVKSIDSYREAIELYLRPAYGHLRLIDNRGELGRDLAIALRKINRPRADADSTDLLRRLAARAVRDGRRISTRPLSEGRITRIMAVGSSACADLVPNAIPVNPFARVSKGRKVRPLLLDHAPIDARRGTAPKQRPHSRTPRRADAVPLSSAARWVAACGIGVG